MLQLAQCWSVPPCTALHSTGAVLGNAHQGQPVLCICRQVVFILCMCTQQLHSTHHRCRNCWRGNVGEELLADGLFGLHQCLQEGTAGSKAAAGGLC